MAYCENYKRHCGGCPLMPRPYAEQLAQKQKKVETLLAGLGPVRPILAAEQPLHYRNKAISTFALVGGRLTSGFYAAHSHRVLPVQQCLLHRPVLDSTIEAVRKAAKACKMIPYNEDTGEGLLRHCLVRCSRDQKQVLVVMVTVAREWPGRRNFVQALRKAAPWVTTIVQNVNARDTSAVLGVENQVLFGSGKIQDTLCGVKFYLSAGSFYQVNPDQAERLYQTALQLAQLRPSDIVLDAYCGVGTIALCAAQQAGQVTGVELNAAAVRDAVANARLNKQTNAHFVQGDATAWMWQAAQEKQRVDVVFLDPPRAGSTPECIKAIAHLAPKKIIYVSCDPQTLARDLKLFAGQGYKTKTIQPVDMFCQTEHVECVVLMTKVQK